MLLNDACEPERKKSLMNSLGKLKNKVDKIRNLEKLCEKLLDKFRRTEDLPQKEMLKDVNKISNQLDIVDLFDEIDTNLQGLIDKIENNLSLVIDMID